MSFFDSIKKLAIARDLGSLKMVDVLLNALESKDNIDKNQFILDYLNKLQLGIKNNG